MMLIIELSADTLREAYCWDYWDKGIQTECYYLLSLIDEGPEWTSCFCQCVYDKRTDRSFVFEKIKEGFTVFPVAMTDEYLLSVLNYEDFPYMKGVLPAEEICQISRDGRGVQPLPVAYVF